MIDAAMGDQITAIRLGLQDGNLTTLNYRQEESQMMKAASMK